MGYSTYNVSSRLAKSAKLGYTTLTTSTMDTVFEQNRKRKIHESMDPKTIKLREARDSAEHPNVFPVILGLDLTGSMGSIPVYLIREGLPHIMGKLIQKGFNDASLLFVGVGDHENDDAPLQVGQFESGDDELDTWLTRTWVEGGGGGNAGESYLLAWYFAANHTATDAWDKRKQKGILVTIGDEPCLSELPKNVMHELMTESKVQKSMTAESLLKAAQEKYNVFHFHVLEGSAGERSLGYWKELLGKNCIAIKDHTEIGNKMVELILNNNSSTVKVSPEVESENSTEELL